MNTAYSVVTLKKPCIWSRCDGKEPWLLNPNRRYILNAAALDSLRAEIESVSLMKPSSLHRPLTAKAPLSGAKILVERHRDRGFGDLLFMTGPLSYIQHISGGGARVDMYALAERGVILDGHPALAHGCTLAGPLEYDSLQNYHYHWFVDSVTEYSEERDQDNVYDALYRQIGVEPASVSPLFKRPSIHLGNEDWKSLDSVYYHIYAERKVDLRRTGYYVVCPAANASLRAAPYALWLNVIKELSASRPVIILGPNTDHRLPTTDMPYGTFVSRAGSLGPNVIVLSGRTPIRVSAALIARAVCAITLDSGPLYIAQAVRTPAISLWGVTTPQSRLGYDHDYMDLAIWNKGACINAGCFAYSDFPATKCPRGSQQHICEPLVSIRLEQVLALVDKVESRQGVPAPSS